MIRKIRGRLYGFCEGFNCYHVQMMNYCIQGLLNDFDDDDNYTQISQLKVAKSGLWRLIGKLKLVIKNYLKNED